MKKVAIISVNYNGKKDTLEFLDSLKKLSTDNCALSTIVVDNGSTDGSVSEIVKKFPEVELLQNGENLGFSGGYNRGLRYALQWGADYFLIINNDTLIKSPDLLTGLIKTAESDEKIGLVSPKILFAKGYEFHASTDSISSPQTSSAQENEVDSETIWYAGGTFDWDNVMSVHRGIDEADLGQYDEVKQVDFVSGCCLLIKREVLEKVGYFDESYFAYFEDNDFSLRVEKTGFKKYYDGNTAIYHKVSQTTGVGSSFTDYLLTRNRLFFGMQFASGRTKFALLRQAVRFLVAGRKAQRDGVIDYLKGVRGKGESRITNHESRGSDVEFPTEVSIVAVNYNTADLIEPLLKSIFDEKSGFDEKNMEVIVLENGSEPNCKSIVEKFKGVKFIDNPENVGFSRGYNQAIHYSKGKYVLMLNSDTEVLEDGIAELLKSEEAHDGKAVLGGKLFFPDRTIQDSCFFLPTITGALKEYFLALKGAYFMFVPPSDKDTKVEGLVMACFVIPRIIFNRVGFLDEGTFLFFEDIEYCRRLKQFNVPIYFVPSAHFIHHHGASTKRLAQGKAYEHLKKGSVHYHGKFYYSLLYLTLWFAQKVSWVKTPVVRG